MRGDFLGAETWRRQTYFACTLPGSFAALNKSGWGHKYLSDYAASKRTEWNECYEERAVRRLPLPQERSVKCPSHREMAAPAVDWNCPPVAGGGVAKPVGRPIYRVLDAGGGSCSLASYLRGRDPSLYKRVAVLTFDVGYNCGFHFVCSERSTLSLQQSWHDPIAVPDESMDVVFHAQGLHHIPRDERMTERVLAHLMAPLRRGGLLHLSAGDSPENSGLWRTVLERMASAQGYAILRKQRCTGHVQYLLRKPG